MELEAGLRARSGEKCELCGGAEDLAAFEPAPAGEGGLERLVAACGLCRAQLDAAEAPDPHHWRCLNESAWSQVPAVQVVAWRMLQRLRDEDWARDLADMIYLDEETLAWAEAGSAGSEDAEAQHRDSNGAALASGDTVTLIKDLPVKGAGFTAKRGTAVRGISLVPDNPGQISGRVNGQQIILLTQFVKKSG